MAYQEAVGLMEACGLQVLETYGDWNFGPFTKNSDLMVFVAKRAP
jgi:hypothetical protein